MALSLALARLEVFEPKDPRAISAEFVAMASVSCDVANRESHDTIREALSNL